MPRRHLYVHAAATLLTIARKRNQPRCPSISVWIMIGTYTRVENKTMTFAGNWMQQVSKMSQAEKGKYHISFYMQFLS